MPGRAFGQLRAPPLQSDGRREPPARGRPSRESGATQRHPTSEKDVEGFRSAVKTPRCIKSDQQLGSQHRKPRLIQQISQPRVDCWHGTGVPLLTVVSLRELLLK
ncbi:MAG: hypothetical protein QOH05_4723 [Acetobacteraceae bacterium]|nr:hypothetical protein [Acetobacteraceae bacterium]